MQAVTAELRRRDLAGQPADDRQQQIRRRRLPGAGGDRSQPAGGRRVAHHRLEAEIADDVAGRPAMGLELVRRRGDENAHRSFE